MPMHTGKITFLSERFGFIADAATGKRFFIHQGSMATHGDWPTLNEGDGVVFDWTPAPRGQANDQAVGVIVTRRRLPAGMVAPRRPSLRHAEAWQRRLASLAQGQAS